MPSPFPGMDPFLEHPDHFPGLHHSLIFCLVEALQPQLPDPYFAKTGQRVWLEYGERYVEPDVELLQGGPVRPGSSAGTAVLEPPQTPTMRPVVVTLSNVPDDEFREPFLEIYAGRGENKRLVTSIEVLSPSNKSPGNQGRDLYLRKQFEIRASPVHLVEIDLLRAGTHATIVPRAAALANAGPFDYHVCIQRFDQRDKCYVYPIRLVDALPTLAIPLLPGDADVELNLQAVFSRCYDAGPYRREIDYQREEPDPPLTAEQAAWAKKLLQTAGASH